MDKSKKYIKYNNKTKSEQETKKEEIKGISSTSYYIVRWIAIVTMVIDYIGYLLSENFNLSEPIYITMRTIGRVSFPLFAFLLVECFFHTKDRKRHLRKLLVIAAISEIPYNLFKSVTLFTLEYQNVCFEFFTCFALLCLLNKTADDFNWKFKTERKKEKFLRILKFDIWSFCWVLTTLLNFDFEWRGLVLITFFYYAKKKKHKRFRQFLGMLIYGLSFFDLSYLTLLFALLIIYIAETKGENKETETKKYSVISKIVANRGAIALARMAYPLTILILIAIRLTLT